MQQKLEQNIHTKDIEVFFQAVEPFIKQIVEREKGKLHQEIQSQLVYYLKITTKEHEERLRDKFPESYRYANGEFDGKQPMHEDHWEVAKVGDIVRKTGWRYASNVENGNYYVVLESNHDHVAVFDVDGEIKTLCFPEEYQLVGNIHAMLEERNELIKLNTREMHVRIWESHGLDSYEREIVDGWLNDNQEEKIVDHFTEYWKTYYDLGVELKTNGLDIISKLLGKDKEE